MNIKITEAGYVNGKSGVGLRFTLNLAAKHPDYGIVQQSTKGRLAFRNRKNDINVLTPVLYLGPAKIRYRPIVLSPGLNDYLQVELAKAYPWIKRKEEPVPATVAASYHGDPVELDLGGEL